MQFLIDASLPRAVADVIRQAGHEATDIRDIGLRTTADAQIAQHARANRFALMSGDFDFADIRFYAPEDYDGIVVIDRPEDSTIPEVLAIVEFFLVRFQPMSALPGRLVIVGPTRIRIRPPLPDAGSQP